MIISLIILLSSPLIDVKLDPRLIVSGAVVSVRSKLTHPMGSRFVSGGTLEKPTERDEEWLRAQRELDERRRQKEENSKQQDGKSLYEVLQENRAAKEEAFQESIKLKNQFRALNEEEAEFLETTLEAERAKEQAVRKETNEQLERFRQQQEKVDKTHDREPTKDNEGPLVLEEDINWAASGKKRKRTKVKEGLMGVKARRTSSVTDEQPAPVTNLKILKEKHSVSDKALESDKIAVASPSTAVGKAASAAKIPKDVEAKAVPPQKTGLSLVRYESDNESD